MAVTLNGANANYTGLSTDNKPDEAAVNALFLELDTGDFYFFTGEEWMKVGRNKGGIYNGKK